MLITLFTDSSHSRILARATWAAWFKADGVAWRYAGPVKGPITSSGQGELAAIANGLCQVTRACRPGLGSKVIVQSDSLEALTALQRNKHRNPYCTSVLAYIESLRVTNELILDLRHVKGHSGTGNPRSAINHFCDREAQRQMDILWAEAAITAPELVRRQAKGKKAKTGTGQVIAFTHHGTVTIDTGRATTTSTTQPELAPNV